MENVKGIDISEHNGAFDAGSAIRQGAQFVIIRCGFGSDYSGQDGKQYLSNVKKCEDAGLPYGVYPYAYAQNTDMAKSEAAHTVRLLRGKRPACGVWYDVEDSSLPAGDTLVQICETYCKALKAAGYGPGIYATASWLKNKLQGALLQKWPKWVAHWGVSAPGYTGGVVLWQYACPPGDAASPTAFDWNLSYKGFGQGSGADLPGPPAKTEENMTKAETQALIDAAVKPVLTKLAAAEKALQALQKSYAYLEDVPEWYRDAVEYYLGNGILRGREIRNGKPFLSITDAECRMLTMMYRQNAEQPPVTE